MIEKANLFFCFTIIIIFPFQFFITFLKLNNIDMIEIPEVHGLPFIAHLSFVFFDQSFDNIVKKLLKSNGELKNQMKKSVTLCFYI